ncbi:unnamed protein product [Knipowitschia caucasica]
MALSIYTCPTRLGVAWEWPGSGLGVAWAWPGRGLGVAWAWPGSGLGVAWAWPGSGLGVAWAWPGSGLGVAWEWPGRGLGVAWEWPGRGLGVAWECLSPAPDLSTSCSLGPGSTARPSVGADPFLKWVPEVSHFFPLGFLRVVPLMQESVGELVSD